MTPTPASVIVVSRHRAAELSRCLVGLTQQDHPQFEVIVVADPAGLAATQMLGPTIKRVAFDQANISVARNLGLAQAAAPVVAFIDDDAVAEPTWLSRLVAPFADDRVHQSTGFVRGRNGISYQWKASEIDHLGADHPFDVPEDRVTLKGGTTQRSTKTQGTNCAFRADMLRRAGGFDPAIRFFLDEADVNLRLSAFGGLTAVVPLAQVHHGYAASERRRADRVPLSLFEIAASRAVFLRRHSPGLFSDRPTPDFVRSEKARAVGHMVAGRIEPRDVRRLMESLADGWRDGAARPLRDLVPFDDKATTLLPLPGTGPRTGLVLFGGRSSRADLAHEAGKAVAEGKIVTVFCLSRGLRAHQHGFRTEGYWWQEGGLLGRSTRSDPRPKKADELARVTQETRRIATFRPMTA